jgi:hypothetical protein
MVNSITIAFFDLFVILIKIYVKDYFNLLLFMSLDLRIDLF